VRHVRFRPEAESEINAAAEWYESRGSILAEEFLRAVDAAVVAVERNPLQHPKVHPQFRRVLLRRFPHSLIFAVADSEVVIVACSHWRQHPRRWSNRSP
jgi:plasmid stabilization system protein ParE